jgi:hypothetical protein
MHAGEGDGGAVVEVEAEELVERDRAEAVAVGQEERRAVDVVGHALHPRAGHGLLAGVGADHLDARDRMALGPRADDVGLVAEAQDEAAHAEAGVIPHQVPQHRLATDGDHRLGHPFGALAEAGAPTAAEHDGGHVSKRDGSRHGRPDYRRGARPAGTVASTTNSL